MSNPYTSLYWGGRNAFFSAQSINITLLSEFNMNDSNLFIGSRTHDITFIDQDTVICHHASHHRLQSRIVFSSVIMMLDSAVHKSTI